MLRVRVLLTVTMALAVLPNVSWAGPYQQTNLVSDIPGLAQFTDPQLVNPWGVAFGGTGPLWVSDNGSGFATLYNGQGVKQGLVVSMPGNTPANPIPITGQVFQPPGTGGFNNNLFLFAGENGAVYGWRGALGTTAETLKAPSNPATGDVYKGLAISGTNLIATNFRTGNVDVFNGSTASVSSFHDATLPAGFAPFGAQTIGNKVYVTFALQNGAKHDDVAGPGNGFVDIFDPTTGAFTRLINGAPGNPNNHLNSPWGVALAPSNFGSFSNDLLVGNFGDGRINAFDPNTGAFLGTLTDASGNPISIDGLWALQFGNGGQLGQTNQLFFTAGINGEADGLFGVLQAVPAITPTVPEPTTAALFAVAGAGLLLLRRRKARPA